MLKTAKETAARWSVDPSLVLRLARSGRIEGACRIGRNWMIPANAKKPADARTKSEKAKGRNTPFFRFPTYINTSEESFFPPLSDEERTLRQALLDYHACRFDAAKEIIRPLSENARNPYVRIAALVYRCYLATWDVNSQDFDKILQKLDQVFASDFPHKQDMMLLRHKLSVDYGNYGAFSQNYHIDPGATYDSSSYEEAAVVAFYSLAVNDVSISSQLRFEPFEIMCMKMEDGGHFLEAQELHFCLVEMFQMQAKREPMLFHMRRGLELALERGLHFFAARSVFYYPDVAHQVLAGFPKDFADEILGVGRELHERYAKFQGLRQAQSYWGILADDEFVYVSFAVQGYSNKQMAQALGVCVNTVSRRLGRIYAKLGVERKRELVDLVVATHQNGGVLSRMRLRCSNKRVALL